VHLPTIDETNMILVSFEDGTKNFAARHFLFLNQDLKIKLEERKNG
jgi:hypothetical protein